MDVLNLDRGGHGLVSEKDWGGLRFDIDNGWLGVTRTGGGHVVHRVAGVHSQWTGAIASSTSAEATSTVAATIVGLHRNGEKSGNNDNLEPK